MLHNRTGVRRWYTAVAMVAVLIGLAVPGAGAVGPPADRIALTGVEDAVRVFVQLQGSPLADAATIGADREIDLQQAGLRAQMRVAGIGYRELRAHRQLFNGLTIKVRRADIGRISGLRGVAGVFLSRKTQLPVPQLHSSVGMIGAPQAWAGDPALAVPGVDGTGITVAVIDTGKSYRDRT